MYNTFLFIQKLHSLSTIRHLHPGRDYVCIGILDILDSSLGQSTTSSLK